MQGVQTAPEQTPAAEMDSGAEIPALPDGIVNDALRQAAEAGDPLALFEVARRYTDGDGIEASLETAAQWYEAAARAGSAPAQYRLANFLEKGHGVKMDVEKSALWYQRAAEQGNALAMHNLAVIYTSGLIGGKPDMESAIGWFQKAADLGVKDSQVNLGIIYAKGIGIEADAVQAYKWLAIAARGGDTDAAGKRDTLAAAMRPEQLEKARGAADLWKAQPLDPEANVAEPKPEWKSGSGESAMLPGSALDATAAAVNREMIAKVQAKLAQKGYDPGPADGQMGARTIDAVKAFQKEAGLPADGQITTELLKKLDPQA
jgi:localization factor PodJL